MDIELTPMNFNNIDELLAILREKKASANPRQALTGVMLEAAMPAFLAVVQKYRRSNPMPHNAAQKMLYLEVLTSAICSLAVSTVVLGAQVGEDCEQCQVRIMDSAMHGIIQAVGKAVGQTLESMISKCEIVDKVTLQ